MTLGVADHQGDLFDEVVGFCEGSLPGNSIYRFLGRERDRLFPDAMFVDLFDVRGRRSVPPSVVATVMVLQRLEGLSDREAVERYAFDVRWRYAAGVGGYGGGGWVRFAHTVLVDMRERLRCSKRPNRVFEVALGAACEAGLVGRKRVLDSTPLYDAVATMDTVTLIRSALRGLLGVVDGEVEAELRAVLGSGDDYACAGKPRIDWDDRAAREQLVDSRARDGFAVLAVLDGRKLSDVVGQAAALPATVVGQDLVEGDDGVLRIARRVAKDRVISTVDPRPGPRPRATARREAAHRGRSGRARPRRLSRTGGAGRCAPGSPLRPGLVASACLPPTLRPRAGRPPPPTRCRYAGSWCRLLRDRAGRQQCAHRRRLGSARSLSSAEACGTSCRSPAGP